MKFKIGSKLTSCLCSIVMLFGLSTSAMAISFGFGVSGGATHVEATGTETLLDNGQTESATEDGQGVLGTAYGQIIVGEQWFGETNGFVLGYEHTFGEAKMRSRTHTYDQIAAKEVTATQVAEAVISDLDTVFIETPGFTPLGLFIMGGISQMTITTNESLDTGAAYGDADVDGATVGFGFKKAAGGVQIKSKFTYTDWDTITLTNSGTKGAGSAKGADKVVATPENWAFTVGLSYNF